MKNKNKNIVLKTCLTALALSVAGLANAQDADMLTYSAISGGELSIAGQTPFSGNNVGGHLAAQAAVVIGANSEVNDIYAGAAVGVGANAIANNIIAGAAVVVGAGGKVGHITAGAAITLGADAGSKFITDEQLATITFGAGAYNENNENDGYLDGGGIQSNDDMAKKMTIIKERFVEIEQQMDGLAPSIMNITNHTDWIGSENPIKASAINIDAGTEVRVNGNVTVYTTEAVTLGSHSSIVLIDGASITWILGGSLNLGANSTFVGTAYVRGAITGATSDVTCGHLYATGPISLRSIGKSCK